MGKADSPDPWSRAAAPDASQRLTPVPPDQPAPLPGRTARGHFYRYLAVTCLSGLASFVAVAAAFSASQYSARAAWMWVGSLVGVLIAIVYLANIARRPVVRRFRDELEAGYTTLPLVGGDLRARLFSRGPRWDYSGVWNFRRRGVHAPQRDAIAPGTYVVEGSTGTWTGTGWVPSKRRGRQP